MNKPALKHFIEDTETSIQLIWESYHKLEKSTRKKLIELKGEIINAQREIKSAKRALKNNSKKNGNNNKV